MAIPDLTELRHLPYKESELFRYILNTTQLGITIYSPRNGWLEANDTFCNMLGYSREELFSLRFKDITHRDDIEEDKKLYQRLLAGDIDNYSLDKRFIDKHGGTLHARVSIDGIRDATGAWKYFIAFVSDITEQRRMEQALFESESKYRSIVETTGDWIWEIDRNGVHTYSNPTIETILGYSVDEIIGRQSFLFMDDGDKDSVITKFQESVRDKSGWRGFVIHWKHKNGGTRILESNAIPIFDNHGELAGFRGTDRDITVRKRAVEALQVRSMQHSIVAGIGKMAMQSTDINRLMKRIIKQLSLTLNVEYTKILEYFPESNDLLLRAGMGWNKGLVGKARVSADRNSQAGYTLISDRPVIVENLAMETRFSGPDLLIDHGVVSGMSVLISGRVHPWGVLGVHTREQRLFTKEDRDFLQSIANILADSIERYHAESEVRQYKYIVDSSDDAITLIDRDYSYLAVNSELLRILQMERSEVIGHSVADIWGKNFFYNEVKQYIDRCLRGETIHIIHEYKRKGGDSVHLNIHYTPHREHDGSISGVVFISRDISAQKKIEEEILRFQHIADTTDDIMSFVDRNYVYRAVNRRFTNVLHKSKDEVIGRTITGIFGEQIFQNVKSDYDRCLSGESFNIKMWSRLPDLSGKYMHRAYSPYRDADGSVAGVVVSSRDITESKLTEDKLREAQRIAQMGFWEYDLKKDQHNWSDEVYYIFGVTKDEFDPCDGNIARIIHPEDHDSALKLRDMAIRENRRINSEYRIIRPDTGEVRHIQNIVEVIRDGTGNPARLFGTVLDITQRRSAEQKIKESRERLRNLVTRLQAIREEERTLIAREIHDELGQGLTALKIDLSLLKSKLPGNWKRLPSSLNKMISDIDSTIDYVRKLSSSLRPPILDDLGLDAAIEWQVDGFAARTGCKYSLDIQENPCTGDYERETAVFRIFQEALNNVARHANADHIRVSLKNQNALLIMELEDNGVGITNEKISDPHSIGLVGMHERAAAFGGEVVIAPAKKGGTVVTATIPVREHTS